MDGGTIHSDLIDLDKAITQVLDTPLGAYPVSELIERAAGITRLQNRLDAALGCHLTAAQQTAALTPSYRSIPVADIAAGSHTDPKSIRSSARLSQWLGDFAAFGEAHRAGSLSVEHLRELRRLDDTATHQHLSSSQEPLIHAAETLDWHDFLRVTAYWRNAADPDGREPRERAARTGMTFKNHNDGSITGRFHLDPLAAQVFTTAIGQETERLRKQAATSTDQPSTVCELRRLSSYQLCGLALINLLIRGHQHPAGSPLVPLINLVLGQELAENLLQRAQDADIDPVDPSADDPNRRCEFIDGTPVHPIHAAVLLALARIRTTVLDKHLNVQTVTLRSRRFPPWMRHLLLIQSRGRCATPGCDAPYQWLQADHIQPASRGGPTNLTNGQPLCGPHNHLKADHPKDDHPKADHPKDDHPRDDHQPD